MRVNGISAAKGAWKNGGISRITIDGRVSTVDKTAKIRPPSGDSVTFRAFAGVDLRGSLGRAVV